MRSWPRTPRRLPVRRVSFGRCTTCCLKINRLWSGKDLVRYAEQLGLDGKKFLHELKEGVYQQRVRDNLYRGRPERRESHAGIIFERGSLPGRVQ